MRCGSPRGSRGRGAWRPSASPESSGSLVVGQRRERRPRRLELAERVGRTNRGSRCPPDRTATSGPRRRRSRSRAPCTSTGIAPSAWAASSSTGTPVVRSAAVSMHAPVHPRDVRAGHQAGRGSDLAGDLGERHDPDRDAVAFAGQAQRPEQSRVLLSVVRISSPACSARPPSTVLSPSVVEPGQRHLGGLGAEHRRVAGARALGELHDLPEVPAPDPRPRSRRDRRARGPRRRAASGTGPSVPAFRYAQRSRIGNCARNAAGSVIEQAIIDARDDAPDAGIASTISPESRQLAQASRP